MMRLPSRLPVALAVFALMAGLAAQTAAHPEPHPGAQDAAHRPNLAPYVPTPQDVVERMLGLARVQKADVVYDLGCGDGRLVITAARKYGARGVGIDIDPQRIAESRANAKKAAVEHLVEFRQEDALTTDVSGATVVTLYLLSSANMKLRPTLQKQLRPGARVVSHQFGMGDWVPDETDSFTDALGSTRVLYLWRIGAKQP